MNVATMAMQVRQALTHLNPNEVRQDAATPVTVEIGAPTPEAYAAIERLLVPDTLTREKQAFAMSAIFRAGAGTTQPVLRIYEQSMPHPEGAFLYRPEAPHEVVRAVLAAKPELNLPLARRFPAFRECVSSDIVKNVAKENAMFALATSLPSIVPFLALPVAIGEFASDTAFLTMNQVRMTFLLGAASGHEIGYREQKAEIASIVASAFGWRALARELVGKIPMGGGIIPKAAIAFAGTFVVGSSIERFYRLGYGFSKSEKEAAYVTALERGKAVASAMLEAYRGKKA
jgi:hypothetical protein